MEVNKAKVKREGKERKRARSKVKSTDQHAPPRCLVAESGVETIHPHPSDRRTRAAVQTCSAVRRQSPCRHAGGVSWCAARGRVGSGASHGTGGPSGRGGTGACIVHAMRLRRTSPRVGGGMDGWMHIDQRLLLPVPVTLTG